MRSCVLRGVCAVVLLLLFFFQAEDGIRDLTVTGVQTCALPISAVAGPPMRGCRISIMLVNTTGNSAIVPLTLGPTQPDSVTTVATSVATRDARSGMSYQRRRIGGILTWR